MFGLEVSLYDCLLFDSWSADQKQISAVSPILEAPLSSGSVAAQTDVEVMSVITCNW